jgi:hypothetical protein
VLRCEMSLLSTHEFAASAGNQRLIFVKSQKVLILTNTGSARAIQVNQIEIGRCSPEGEFNCHSGLELTESD